MIEEIENTKCYQIKHGDDFAGSFLVTESEDRFFLWQFQIMKEFRGLGLGTSAIIQLISSSDKDIYLEATPYCDSSFTKEELESWYSNLGFSKCPERFMVYKV